ncbi:MAG: exodeoxyribonuclease V subunit RecC [Candidatus Westeberhardia cardiocondylae]|nr:exodeoxyribonuclease V subunit RecC [Candidatus Westeberhardia cardiocondylae]
MFFVYRSNSLESHKDVMIKVMRDEPLENPLQSEVVIVENKKMEKWISVELSLNFGIFSNVEFFFAEDFIWYFSSCVSSKEIISRRFFSNLMISWRIMKILPSLSIKEEFKFLNNYVYIDQNKCRNFYFSYKMALLFNKYMVFKPWWLISWENNNLIDELNDTCQIWQSFLWCSLLHDIKISGGSCLHIANFYKEFSVYLEKSVTLLNIPKRIFVFGIPSKLILCYLRDISYYIDVYLFFIDSCFFCSWDDFEKEYYNLCDNFLCNCSFDKLKDRNVFFVSCSKSNNLISFDVDIERKKNNFLLFLLGKIRKNFFYLFYSIFKHYHKIDLFVKLKKNKKNLLSIIQYNILYNKNYDFENIFFDVKNTNNIINKFVLDLKDISFSVHICSDLRREVEVLYNFLFKILLNDLTLKPKNIVVIVSDMDLYCPLIQEVFSRYNIEGNGIPYVFSDSKIIDIHPVFSIFLMLLELPKKQCFVEDVLELLGYSFVSSNFSIDKDDINLIYRWIVNSGIRWGLGNNTYYDLMLPIIGKNTWEFGLDRMLFSYSVNNKIKYNDNWNDIYPCDEYFGQDFDLIGSLSMFIHKLDYWREYFSVSRSLLDWNSCIDNIFSDFFCIIDVDLEKCLLILKKEWKRLLFSGLFVRYSEFIPVDLLLSELRIRLNRNKVNKRFLCSGVNFCSLFSMCFLPFRVVCFLGMDYKVYPRKSFFVNFDLMKYDVKIGDIVKRDSDCYLFLNFLLGAEDIVYISYIKKNLHVSCYPSVLVDNIIDYISRNFYLFGDEYLNEETMMYRVKCHICHFHGLYDLCKKVFHMITCKKYVDMFSCMRIGVYKKVVNYNSVLSRDFIVSVNLLKKFYFHPIRFWFNKKLSVFYSDFLCCKKYESFVVDYFVRYRLNVLLLSGIVNCEDIKGIFKFFSGIGVLPYNAFGEEYFNEQYNIMFSLSRKIKKYYLFSLKNLKINFVIDNIKICGYLSCVHGNNNGLLRWKAGKLFMRDIFLFWLEHLIYCVSGGIGDSRIFGVGSNWCFKFIEYQDAKELLLSLLLGYKYGLVEPLFLIYQLGGSWLFSCFNKKTLKIDWSEYKQRKARDSIICSWYGREKSGVFGVNSDIYLRKIINTLNDDYIDMIIDESNRYLLPLFMFRK